jgi:hypothetical protein
MWKKIDLSTVQCAFTITTIFFLSKLTYKWKSPVYAPPPDDRQAKRKRRTVCRKANERKLPPARTLLRCKHRRTDLSDEHDYAPRCRNAKLFLSTGSPMSEDRLEHVGQVDADTAARIHPPHLAVPQAAVLHAFFCLQE